MFIKKSMFVIISDLKPHLFSKATSFHLPYLPRYQILFHCIEIFVLCCEGLKLGSSTSHYT